MEDKEEVNAIENGGVVIITDDEGLTENNVVKMMQV